MTSAADVLRKQWHDSGARLDQRLTDHGAEIALLRDLYPRWTATPPGET